MGTLNYQPISLNELIHPYRTLDSINYQESETTRRKNRQKSKGQL